MFKFIDRIPLLPLAIAAIFMSLAPFTPEPHLLEKSRMLVNGELTKPVDEGAFASLASKLAVPATVVGAVAFSALAGGGGVFGDNNAAGDANPDVNTSSNDEDQQESGETPETNPVSPS